MYEICKALDKQKYQVDVLKVSPLNDDKNWADEFYYQPTQEIGCRIILLSHIVNTPLIPQKDKLIKRVSDFSKKKLNLSLPTAKQDNVKGQSKKKLSDFFDQYDCINFSGIAVYHKVCHHFHLHPENAFIHVLTFSFQHQNIYHTYNKNEHYDFISPVTPAAIKEDLREFNDYNYTFFPLCFETSPYQVVREKGTEKLTIAIFTRLAPMKPLDPFFYAFKILTEQGLNVELKIYGAGDPGALGLTRQLKYLYIADKVKFMGHSASIPATLRNDAPDLIWFQSANKEPGGYAALEIAMSGLPQIFWDFQDMGTGNTHEGVFPSFTEITSFVNYSKELLSSAALQEDLGNKQKEYVLRNYSIQKHIHILEELFDKGS